MCGTPFFRIFVLKYGPNMQHGVKRVKSYGRDKRDKE